MAKHIKMMATKDLIFADPNKAFTHVNMPKTNFNTVGFAAHQVPRAHITHAQNRNNFSTGKLNR